MGAWLNFVLDYLGFQALLNPLFIFFFIRCIDCCWVPSLTEPSYNFFGSFTSCFFRHGRFLIKAPEVKSTCGLLRRSSRLRRCGHLLAETSELEPSRSLQPSSGSGGGSDTGLEAVG